MADSDKKKGGMVLVISVGGKPPKKPEDTADPEVKKAKMCACGSGKPQASCCPNMKKAIPEAGMMSDDEISARHRAQMSDLDHGDAHSGTHGAYGVGDPTAPFGEPMQPGGPLIEPTANVAINPDQNVNPQLDDWDNRREERHREIPLFLRNNYRDPSPWYPDDVLDDDGAEDELYEALNSSSPEVHPSEGIMDDPMDLGEDMGGPEEGGRPSLLETMQDRYGAQKDKEGNVTQMPSMGPTGIKRLASGQPPKNIFRNSEGPFRFAWQLLKFNPDQHYRGDDTMDTNPRSYLDTSDFETEQLVEQGLLPEDEATPSLYDQHGPNTLMQNLLEGLKLPTPLTPPPPTGEAPPTEDEEDPLGAPQNPRPNSPTPVGQEEMVREGGDDLDARLEQIAAELARRDGLKDGTQHAQGLAEGRPSPGITPRSAGDNPMFRHLRSELEQMQSDTEAEIGRRDENREARRAVRRGV